MEKEENKKNCCETNNCCNHDIAKCCQNWRKCHMVKRIIWVAIVIVAFCLGSQWGEMKALSGRSYQFERGYRMMDLNYGKFNRDTQSNGQQTTGEVTVKVGDQAPAPKQ